MAEQQQDLTVDVTLYWLKNVLDAPFFVFNFLINSNEKIVVVDTFIELLMNDNAINKMVAVVVVCTGKKTLSTRCCYF
jgi:hypothetical protein